MTLRKDADQIIQEAIAAVLPDAAVKRTLETKTFDEGKVILVSIGKAGWQMAKAAYDTIGERIDEGIVITKYDHSKGEIGNLEIHEAGHPVPDENSYSAAKRAVEMVQNLTEKDTVVFLISGGGSALFEVPLCTEEELDDLTRQLLASGADITEMNTIRKRMSMVKGGKFAKLCEPAKVIAIVLSDILGDPLDMIASGPAAPDTSTSEDAENIVKKYGLKLSDNMKQLLAVETPKELTNVETYVNGSVRELCAAAEKACAALGYETVYLTDQMNCEAREAGRMLAAIAKTHIHDGKDIAYIAGGETVVHLVGKGLGGRNQEMALAAGIELSGLENAAVFSAGSDGTDGPTDAAGGYADGTMTSVLPVKEAVSYLNNNDAYHALEKTGGLIMTGATGTNVNDLSVVLIRGKRI